MLSHNSRGCSTIFIRTFFLLFLGTLSPFKSISLFCTFLAITEVFLYVYIMTLLVACITYSGRTEAANRHGTLCCLKVLPLDRAGGSHQDFIHLESLS